MSIESSSVYCMIVILWYEDHLVVKHSHSLYLPQIVARKSVGKNYLHIHFTAIAFHHR